MWWQPPAGQAVATLLGEPACPGSHAFDGVELVPHPDARHVTENPIGHLVLTVGKEAQERNDILDEYRDSGEPLSTQAKSDLDAIEHNIEAAFQLVNVQTNAGSVPSVFEFYRIIGSGSYGTVAEYRAGRSAVGPVKPLAVKVCSNCEASALPIDRPLTCNVVKTAVFSGAQIQVMEMGTDIAKVPLTAKTIVDFERFANSAAKCFDRTDVACADWKPDNITAFPNPCGDQSGWVFRVIDIDGVVRLDKMSNGLFVSTYACAKTPYYGAAYDNDDTAIRLAAAYAMVNTAYAIEVSKVLFKTKSIDSETEREFLDGIRKAAGDISFDQVIDEFEGHTAVKYPQVIDLLARFSKCRGRWEHYRSVYTEWFATQSRFNWLGERWAQKFVDLQQSAT